MNHPKTNSGRRYPTPPPYAIPRGPPTPSDVSTPERPAQRAQRLRDEYWQSIKTPRLSPTSFCGRTQQPAQRRVAENDTVGIAHDVEESADTLMQSTKATNRPSQSFSYQDEQAVSTTDRPSDSATRIDEQGCPARRDGDLSSNDNSSAMTGTSKKVQGRVPAQVAPSNFEDVHPARRRLIDAHSGACTTTQRRRAGSTTPVGDRTMGDHDMFMSGGLASSSNDDQNRLPTSQDRFREPAGTLLDHLVYPTPEQVLQYQRDRKDRRNAGIASPPFKRPTDLGSNRLTRKKKGRRYDFSSSRQCTPPPAPKQDKPLPLRSPSLLRQIVAGGGGLRQPNGNAHRATERPNDQATSPESGDSLETVDVHDAVSQPVSRNPQKSSGTHTQKRTSTTGDTKSTTSQVLQASEGVSTLTKSPSSRITRSVRPRIKVEDSVSADDSLAGMVSSSSTSSAIFKRLGQPAGVSASTSIEMENRRLRSIMKQIGFTDASIDIMLDQAATKTWKQVVADMVVELEGVWPGEGAPQQSIIR